MKQKQISFTVLLLLTMGITALQAQQSGNAAGGNATGAGGSASYSVGQVAYTYVSGTSGSSNQGVQQPYEFFVTGIDEHKDITLVMSVFPNPTQSIVNLKVENTDFDHLTFQVYDIAGKLLLNEKVTNTITPVAMQAFGAGTYFLTVADHQTSLKKFTIIKNN